MPLEDFLAKYGSRASGPGLSASRSLLLRGKGEPVHEDFIGRVLRGTEKVLGAPANLVSRAALLPIAKALSSGDPYTQSQYEELGNEKRNIYAGDILNVAGPLAHDSEDDPVTGFLKGTGRFISDLGTDPLSYLGIGETSKLGKVSEMIAGAKASGETIGLDSKLAEQAARLKGEKPSANLIRTFDKSLASKSLPEQIRGGQKSLLSFNVPFTHIDVPLVGGEIGAKLSQPFSALSRVQLEARIAKGIEKAFPGVDPTVHEGLHKLALHQAGEVNLDAQALKSIRGDVTRDLGIPIEQINAKLHPLVDKEVRGLPARMIATAAGPFIDTVKRLFSNSTGNKEFDTLYNEYKNMAVYRADQKVQEGKDLNTAMDELSQEMNIPREQLDKQVTAEVERLKEIVPKLKEILPDRGTNYKAVRPLEDIINSPEAQAQFEAARSLNEGEANQPMTAQMVGPEFTLPPITDIPYGIDDKGKVHFGDVNDSHLELGAKVYPDKIGLDEFGDAKGIEPVFAHTERLDLDKQKWDPKDIVIAYQPEKGKLRLGKPGEMHADLLTPEEVDLGDKLKGELGYYDKSNKKFITDKEMFEEKGITDSSELDPNSLNYQPPATEPERVKKPSELAKPFGSSNTLYGFKGLGRIHIQEDGTLHSGFHIGEGLDTAKKAFKSYGLKDVDEATFGHSIDETADTQTVQLKDIGTPEEYTPPALKPDSQVDPRIAHQAAEISERQARQLEIEKTSGVRVIPLTADREYIAHVMTPEARDAIRDNLIAKNQLPKSTSAKDMSAKLANAARREFVQIKPEVVDDWLSRGLISKKDAVNLKSPKDGLDFLDKLLEKGEAITDDQYTEALHTLSVDEVNQLAAAGKLRLVGNKPIAEFFHTDPVYSTTIRGVRGEKARTAAEFYTELKERGFAVPAEQAPEGWLPVKQAELEGHRVPPEVATAMNRWYDFIHGSKETNAFLELYDKTQDWWKAWTLAIFPAYHVRNFVGNMWNNYLAGVHNPRFYKLAGDMQRGIDRSFVSGSGKLFTTESLIQVAKELGVIDRGFVAKDVARTIEQELSGGKWLSAGRDSKLIRKGFEVGQGIENNARLAHFMSKMEEGYSAAEAAMSVKKYLFDYSELTDFERKVMKRFFPFYAWTRKNVPLQIQHLIMEPAKFSAAFKAKNEFSNSTPANERYLPTWMTDNFPLRIRRTSDGKYEYFLLNNWLPAADLAKVLQIHQTAATMLAPLPKEVLQQAFNYDYFLKKKVETIPGEQTKFLGVDMPSRVVHGAKVIRLLNELDKLTAQDTDLLNKVTGIVTGKTYLFDPQKGFSDNKVRVNKTIDDLKMALRRESRKPKRNAKEIARITALITEASKEY